MTPRSSPTSLSCALSVDADGWILQGPAGGSRRMVSPLSDHRFRRLIASLREWSSRPVPVDRPDPHGTGAFVAELARRVALRLTEILLLGEDRRRISRALEGQGQVRLVIRVRAATAARAPEADAALALPWELLSPARDGTYPVSAGRLSIVREAVTEQAPTLDQAPGPLTLAVIIAAPENRIDLPYEEESFRLLAALEPLGQSAVFANLGELSDLVSLVADVRATAIHFRGHGAPGGLFFEDQLGFAEEVPVAELRRRLATVLLGPQRAGTFPRLFFLAAPYSAQAASEAQETASAAALHRSGFAQVVGFFGPISAELNTRLEERFYGALASGDSTLVAVERSRAALAEPVSEAAGRVHYPFGWCQLAIYNRGPELPLARPGAGDPKPLIQRRTVEVSGLPVLEHGFIGRRGLQHEVRRRVEREGRRLVVIQGLGGLGKTALASQLLVRAFAPEPEDQLVLRCQETAGDPVLELRSQAEEHGRIQKLPFWEERVRDLRERVPDPAKGLAEVLRSIRRQRPDLVVYVDNAETLQTGPATDDPEALGSWRPGLGAWWSEMERLAEDDGVLLLITTRYAWQELSSRAHLGLPPMAPADSLRLIDSFDALRELPLDVRVRLAGRVDGHPRTVEFLDRLVAQQGEKVKSITDAWRDLIAPALPAQEQQIRADLLLEELWKRLSRAARQQLQRLAALRRPARGRVIDRLGGARDELIRAGWLTRYREQVIDDAGNWWVDLWGLHGTVRDFLRTVEVDELVQDGHRLAADAFEQETLEDNLLLTDRSEAIFHLFVLVEGDRAWPIVRDHTLWLRERARFKELLEVLEGCEAAAVTGDRLAHVLVLQAQMRSSLGERGDGLVALLDRALGYAESPDSRSGALQEKADALNDLGRFDEAEDLLRETLRIDEASCGISHPNYCSALFALANTLDAQGRSGEAEDLLEESIDRLEQRLGPDHEFSGKLRHALAGVLERQGRYEEAETAIRRALSDPHESEDHPDHAASLHTLAQILQHQGQYHEAEEALRRSLAKLEQALGDRHPDCATALNTLAGLLVQHGKSEEAQRLARRSLELTEASLGVDSFEYGKSLQILASALDDQGRYQDAEKVIREALKIQESNLGSDHPDLLPTLNGLGLVLHHQARLEEAERIFRQALALAGRLLGARHPSCATILQSLANVLMRRDKLGEAESLLRQALEIEQAAYATDGAQTTTTIMFTLAQVLDEQEQHEEAESLIRRCLRIEREGLGADHLTYASSLQELALVVSHQGRIEEALKLLRESIALQVPHRDAWHPSLVSAWTNEARLLVDIGDLEEAETIVNGLSRTLESVAESSPEDLAEVLATTAEVQCLLDRPQAQATAHRALELLEAEFGADHPLSRRLGGDLLLIADEDLAADPAPPPPSEVLRLDEDVARLRTSGAEHRTELRDRLEEFADALMRTGRHRDAASAMAEVVALDQELSHPELQWDQRFLRQLLELAEITEQEVSGKPDP